TTCSAWHSSPDRTAQTTESRRTGAPTVETSDRSTVFQGEVELGLLAAVDLALREVEDLREELAEPFLRERSAVQALEVAQHPFLAFGVDEVDAPRLLVLLDARHQLEALVEGLDERAVGVRDLLSKLPDQRIVGVHALSLRDDRSDQLNPVEERVERDAGVEAVRP